MPYLEWREGSPGLAAANRLPLAAAPGPDASPVLVSWGATSWSCNSASEPLKSSYVPPHKSSNTPSTTHKQGPVGRIQVDVQPVLVGSGSSVSLNMFPSAPFELGVGRRGCPQVQGQHVGDRGGEGSKGMHKLGALGGCPVHIKHPSGRGTHCGLLDQRRTSVRGI